MREHVVRVWDEPYTVTVYKKSKSVWVAVGDYMGRRVEVKGSSERSALRWWVDAARYRGN